MKPRLFQLGFDGEEVPIDEDRWVPVPQFRNDGTLYYIVVDRTRQGPDILMPMDPHRAAKLAERLNRDDP